MCVATAWFFLAVSMDKLEVHSRSLVPTLPIAYFDQESVVIEKYAVFPTAASAVPRQQLWYVPRNDEAATGVNSEIATDTNVAERVVPLLDTVATSQRNSPPAANRTPVGQRSTVTPSQIVSTSESSSSQRFSVLTMVVFDETNTARRAAGAPPLQQSEVLAAAARARSADMVRRNYFGHVTPDGCDLECHSATITFSASMWGENIAWYEPYFFLTETELGAHFVREWLKSSGHRLNMLNREFTHQGIGIALDGEKIIVTVIFATAN
jgi:uncharacterized protein YkwD